VIVTCYSCQFVVRHGLDYSIHAADPDTLVQWDSIEQVVRTSRAHILVNKLCLFDCLLGYRGFRVPASI